MSIEDLLKAHQSLIGDAILALPKEAVALAYYADKSQFAGLDAAQVEKLRFRNMLDAVFPTPAEPGALRTMWVLIYHDKDIRWVRMHVYPEPNQCASKA